MPRQNLVRTALFVSLALLAAAVYGFAAEDKEKPSPAATHARGRRDAARMVFEGAMQHRVQEAERFPDVGFLHDRSVRWMEAEKDLAQTKADRLSAVEGHLKRMQSFKESVDAEVRASAAPRYNGTAAEFFCLEALDMLAAARADGK